jgi:hypothetical protein
MARRKSSRGETRQRTARGKSRMEARVERITWALLVLVIAAMQFLPEDLELPNYFVPFLGALILLGSGAVQYSRHWRVSPFTWIGGGLMTLLAFYSIRLDPTQNFQREALVISFLVILLGVLLDET